jgi:hypothetical protein
VRKGLIVSHLPPRQRWREVSAWLQIALVFGASIVVAQFNPGIAKLVWLLLAVPAVPMPKAKPSEPHPGA